MNIFEQVSSKNPKCDICGSGLIIMYGNGWDNDIMYCIDSECGAEYMFPTTTESPYKERERRMNIKNVEQLETAKKQVKDFNDTIERLQLVWPKERAQIDSLVYQRDDLVHQINCAESFMESCTVMMENKLLKQKVNELQEALNRAPSIERNKNLQQMNKMIVNMENLKDALWNLFVMCGKHPTILKIAHKEVTEAGRVLLKYNENTFITLEESRDNRTQKNTL